MGEVRVRVRVVEGGVGLFWWCCCCCWCSLFISADEIISEEKERDLMVDSLVADDVTPPSPLYFAPLG